MSPHYMLRTLPADPGANHPHGAVAQIIGGGTGGLSLSTAGERFVPMFDGDIDSDESEMQQAMPIEGEVSDFYVRLEGNATTTASTDNYVFTVRNGGDPGADALTCTIVGEDDECEDTPGTHLQCFEVGDLISVRVLPNDTGDLFGREMHWTAKFTPKSCTFVPEP